MSTAITIDWQQATDRDWQCFHEGYRAYHDPRQIPTSPYADDTREGAAWVAGFRMAMEGLRIPSAARSGLDVPLQGLAYHIDEARDARAKGEGWYVGFCLDRLKEQITRLLALVRGR